MQPPRSPLVGRYRFLTTLQTGDSSPRWAALDSDSGQNVLAAVVDAGEASRWEALRGVTHLHLAAVLEVVAGASGDAIPGGSPPAPSVIVVSEIVPGRTLRGQLQKGQIHPFKAVAWVLRLIDAITLVHAKGGVVGAISPRSIVVEPVGRAIAPVQATNVAPPLASFCSPERLSGGGPSADDDIWALHACLYAALTGVAPFAGDATNLLHRIKSGKPRPLADFGVDEPILQRVIEQGLLPDERLRTTDLTALCEALDAWERGREPVARRPNPPAFARKVTPGKLLEPLVFDEAKLPDVAVIGPPGDSTEATAADDASALAAASNTLAQAGVDATAPVIPAAPPLPVLSAPRSASTARRRLGLLLGGGGLLLIAIVTVGVTVTRTPKPDTVQTPVASASAPAEASGKHGEQLTPSQQRAACIASYFEIDVLEREQNLDFVCSGDDYREISARVFSLARPERDDSASDAGMPAEDKGIVVHSDTDPYDLGWYEMAGTAIIRTTCCANAKPIELPPTAGWCQQLQGQVRNIADASRKPVDLSPYGHKFDDAVRCLYSTGTKRPYDYEKPPTEQQQKNFQRFLKHAAESDAKRSRMKWLR